MIVKKYHLDSFYYIFELEKHLEIKDHLLQLISDQDSEKLEIKDSYQGDNISRLEWNRSSDFSRPWVSILGPYLNNDLDKISNELGYQKCLIHQIWFQQYFKNDYHGWHVHGHNFTGVYYLELPKNSPKTQLINPFTQDKLILPEIYEGCVLVFPSYVIHRAPYMDGDDRKTIVSFNCDIDKVNIGLLNHITTLAETLNEQH
jgi:hypothetical protein